MPLNTLAIGLGMAVGGDKHGEDAVVSLLPDPFPVYVWPDGWSLVRPLAQSSWEKMSDDLEPTGWHFDDIRGHSFSLHLLDDKGAYQANVTGSLDVNEPHKVRVWIAFTRPIDVNQPLPVPPETHVESWKEHMTREAARHLYDVLWPLLVEKRYGIGWDAAAEFNKPMTELIPENPFQLPVVIAETEAELEVLDKKGKRPTDPHQIYTFSDPFGEDRKVRHSWQHFSQNSLGVVDMTDDEFRARIEAVSDAPTMVHDAVSWYLWSRLLGVWDAAHPPFMTHWDTRLPPGSPGSHQAEHDGNWYGKYNKPGALWSGKVLVAGRLVLVSLYVLPDGEFAWEVDDPYATVLGFFKGQDSATVRSTVGIVDALRRSHLVISRDKTEEWLDDQAIEGDPVYADSPYWDLGELPPMLWDNDYIVNQPPPGDMPPLFIEYVETMTDQNLDYIRKTWQ